MSAFSIGTPSSLYNEFENVICVMQGEIGIASPHSKVTELRSSIPTHCIILTLWHKDRKIAVMAHIDDYTSVRSTINKIELLLRKNFEVSITDGGFSIFEMGGCEEMSSKKQRDDIYSILNNFNVNRLSLLDSKRLQVRLNSADGEVSLDETTNRTLEYLQKREYGEFNHFLDQKYPKVPGKEVPFFESRQTCRNVPYSPFLQDVDEETEMTYVSESSSATRFEFDKDVHKDIPGWEKNAFQLEKMGIIKFQLIGARLAIGPSANIKLIIRQIITTHFSAKAPLLTSLESDDYSKMLRQAASSDGLFVLFKALLNHASSLEIDLLKQGPTSGTVWDVANKHTTIKALQLLKNQNPSSAFCAVAFFSVLIDRAGEVDPHLASAVGNKWFRRAALYLGQNGLGATWETVEKVRIAALPECPPNVTYPQYANTTIRVARQLRPDRDDFWQEISRAWADVGITPGV